MIEITINGDIHSIQAETCLADIIAHFAPTEATVAAVNEVFVPRSRHSAHILENGDCVELLTPMEGG